ncbi:MAG TPA: hypothetical protein VJ728_17225 [Candidatus Binataceae bacterium]|nr:hypothetical protein [Candidatus Binataceae bacterium]
MERSTLAAKSNLREDLPTTEAYASGVSWPAVIAGAFVTAALWLILLVLGVGIGLSSVSPWSNIGASASGIGAAAIIWMIVVQFIASSMGGYLAGRLRTKWASIHTDEVYFRDTAHGFLVWSVGLVITAAFLASAASFIVGGAAQSPTALTTARGPETVASVSSDAGIFDPAAYFLSRLFRSDHLNSDRSDAPARAEAKLVFAHDLRQKNLPTADRIYVARLVAAQTGLTQMDAENQVSTVFAQLQQETDATRSAIARVFLWLFVALLIGAFSASFAATIGGRQRDRLELV